MAETEAQLSTYVSVASTEEPPSPADNSEQPVVVDIEEKGGADAADGKDGGDGGDGGDGDEEVVDMNMDDEEMVIRLGQLIPNYKTWLQENTREVYCACEMTLLSVDLSTQTFEVELEARLYWKQPELKKVLKEDQTWKMFDDQYAIPIDLDDPFDGDLALEWIEQEYDFHDDLGPEGDEGVVELLLHLKDKFAERMELEMFPVDRQFLNIKLMGRSGEDEGNWAWITSSGEDHPDWVPEDYRGNNQLQARLGPAVADYQMFAPWADFNIFQTPKPGSHHCLDKQPPFKLRFRVQRYPGYYVGSIIVPMVLIIVCCYSSLAVPPADVADRLSVSITLMLATVAFKFVTGGILPPVSYLTWMDKYMTTLFVVIAAFVLDNSIANSFGKTGARVFDAIFGLVVAIILIGTTGFMLFALYTDSMRLDWHDMDAEDRESDDDDFVSAEDKMVLGPKSAEESEEVTTAAENMYQEWKKDPKGFEAKYPDKVVKKGD